MMSREKRFFVIGSNSFSGSDFVDFLLEDPTHQVLGISRSPEKSSVFLPYKRRSSSGKIEHRFKFFQRDLNHQTMEILRLVDDFEPEYVVNFAAQSEVGPSWETPEDWFETNTVSLSRLMTGLRARKFIKRYVHISSPEVYGSCEGRVTESAPLNPSTPYAASKASADLFLSTLSKNFDFPIVTIRATNVYGAYQQLWKIIPRTTIFLRMNRTISLHGGGKAVKSYIHIRDVSRGEYLAMVKGTPGSIYHLSPEQGYPVCDVVRMMCDLMGCDFQRSTEVVGERLGQDAAYVIDSTRAREELGWKPAIDIQEGLQGVVTWIETHWKEIQRLPLEYQHMK